MSAVAAVWAASALLIVYPYVIYPLGVALIGWLRPRSWRQDASYLPSVTMIVSAYNEESVIEEKLRNCLALDYPRDRLEIVVASESSDGTNDIVRAVEGVRLMAFADRQGKSATLRRVMPACRGDIVVFSDANTRYASDAVRMLVRNFADTRVGAVIGRLQYLRPSGYVGGRGEVLYWKYDHWFRYQARRTMGIIPGITGGLFAIRRDLYFPLDVERGDDYELCTGIAIRGRAVVFEPDAVASEEASENTKQQFSRKVRLVRWNLVSSLLLTRDALRFGRPGVAVQVASHRLLRYLAPVWLVAFLLSSIWLTRPWPLVSILVGLQVAFYGAGVAGWRLESRRGRVPSFLLLPAYFVMVNTAASLALCTAVVRGQSALWQKQR